MKSQMHPATVKFRNKSQVPVSAKNSSKTLGSLLRYMEGIEVIVELKTGKRHRGILASADEFMNLTLENMDSDDRGPTVASTANSIPRATAPPHDDDKQGYVSSGWHPVTFTPPSAAGAEKNLQDSIYSSLDIRGSNIRYIHFPDNADLSTIVKAGVDRERNAAKKYSRGKRKK